MWKVIFLSLTITSASRIHILEPSWNPAVEDQAIGRKVRIGQSKIPTVIRYLAKDSVEQVSRKRLQRIEDDPFYETDDSRSKSEVISNAR